MTTEAVEDLFGRGDGEARRFFAVEGAEGCEAAPGAFEREVAADDIHDVTGCANVIEDLRRDEAGHVTTLNIFGKKGSGRRAG